MLNNSTIRPFGCQMKTAIIILLLVAVLLSFGAEAQAIVCIEDVITGVVHCEDNPISPVAQPVQRIWLPVATSPSTWP